MKKWILPTIEELDLKYTATLGTENELSGEEEEELLPTPTPELGTCNNPNWEGNGLTIEEAQQNDPFWENKNTSYWNP